MNAKPGTRTRATSWIRRFALLVVVSIAAFVALATGTLMALMMLGLTPLALAAAWFARRRFAREVADAERIVA